MSKIGIDVSSYQGKIDWEKAKESGIKFSIIKIIRKDLNPDKQFESNWKGCEEAGIPVIGVYNYLYSRTETQFREAAMAVVRTLAGRKARVWADVEDQLLKGLGVNLIKGLQVYQEVIETAGLEFGVYTGESFYNSYIKPYGGLACPLWIARYGKNNGNMDLKYQPQIDGMIGWQYTSKGRVGGVNGNVDMNIWYKELEDSNGAVSKPVTNNPYSEPTRVLYKKIVNMRGEDVKWLQWELIRHGCLEKNNSKGKSNIDGILGKDTSNAIYEFQRKSKISVDGKCGTVTRAYLKK